MAWTKSLLLCSLALIVVAGGAIGTINVRTGRKLTSLPWSACPPDEVRDACRIHVSEANRKAAAAISRRTSALTEFIRSRKAGARPFAEDVVSWYGKWRAVSVYLPLTDKEGHKKYVAEKFSEHIFTADDLAAAVRLAVEGSMKDLDGIENELAVKLRQEILGRSLTPDESAVATDEFKKMIAQVVTASQWDAAKTAGNLVTDEVLGQIGVKVLTAIGVALGVDMSLLSAGAANSWWSLGTSAVIGFAVDEIWGWVDDPAEDIEKEMQASLDALSDKASAAIFAEMTKVMNDKSLLWQKTTEKIAP